LSQRMTGGDDFEVVVAKLDALFQKDWSQRDLRPAAAADDLTVARRLSLALTGTIPSLEEIRVFESGPSSQGRSASHRLDGWLAGILNDERYYNYLAERLARAYVGVQDGPFILYRRRRFVAWLADQLRERRPYDEIARELISS